MATPDREFQVTLVTRGIREVAATLVIPVRVVTPDTLGREFRATAVIVALE